MEIHPLVSKLKIGPGQKILVINAPIGFINNLNPVPENTHIETAYKTGFFDMVLLFVMNRGELKQFGETAIGAIKTDSIFWIAYPKKSSGIKSDLTRDEGWDFLDPYGLRAVSNIAIDETWSGLRFKKDPEGRSHQERMTAFKNNKTSTENRIVNVPPDFMKALNNTPEASIKFDAMAYTHRKEYVRWIEEAKKQETRAARIQKAVERIARGIKFS